MNMDPTRLSDSEVVFTRPASFTSELNASQGHDDREIEAAFQRELSHQSDTFHEVIMALYTGDKFSLGCAYFTTRDGTLYLSEDIPVAGLDIAEQLINHAEPTTVLVSARTPKPLLDFLEAKVISGPGTSPLYNRLDVERPANIFAR